MQEERIIKGYTQKDLSELCSVSRSTIKSIENGNTYGSVPLLIKISKELNVSIDYLVGLKDEK